MLPVTHDTTDLKRRNLESKQFHLDINIAGQIVSPTKPAGLFFLEEEKKIIFSILRCVRCVVLATPGVGSSIQQENLEVSEDLW